MPDGEMPDGEMPDARRGDARWEMRKRPFWKTRNLGGLITEFFKDLVDYFGLFISGCIFKPLYTLVYQPVQEMENLPVVVQTSVPRQVLSVHVLW